MDKILILGINGFSGKHFQQYIITNGFLNDYCFVGSDIEADTALPFKYIQADLLNKDELEGLIIGEQPEYIINLVGNFAISDQEKLLLINAELPHGILEIVNRNKIKVKKILLIGSAAEYGNCRKLPVKESDELNPVSFYGLSKVFQSQYASYYHSNFNLNISIGRTFNIVGEGMSTALSLPSFIKQINDIKDEGTIYTGSLDTKRDFLDIDDIIDAYWKILLYGKPGSVYNICSGKSLFIKELLEHMIKVSGKRINIETQESYLKKNDLNDIYGDNTRIIQELGWKPEKNVFNTLTGLIQKINPDN